jgi:hypothetical protein
VLGMLFIAIILAAIQAFNLDSENAVFLAIIIVVIYGIIVSFLLEPKIIKEVVYKETEKIPLLKTVQIGKTEIKTIEIEKPVEKRIVREVPKTIMIDKPIFIEKPKKKLNIPKYEYIASSQTMTFHKRNCRFSKLIKRKYKEHSNDEKYFLKKKYKPCKVCLGKYYQISK